MTFSIMTFSIWAGVDTGFKDKNRAAAQAICGEAIEVPKRTCVPSPILVERMLTPWSPDVHTTRDTPSRVRRREVGVALLSRWVFDGRAKARAASPLRERSLGDLVLRETREEENAIEEGTTRRKRQVKNYLYQFIQRVPLNVQNAFRNARQRNKGLINLSNLC
jgi:hypothetical protein